MERVRDIAVGQERQDAATLFLAKVFKWMAVGLAATGLTAYAAAHSKTAMELIFGNRLLFYGLVFGELALVFGLSARIAKLSVRTASALFFFYSVLNGLTLAAIFVIYTGTSIAATFFIAGSMFGAMAVYGLVTKRDLAAWGSFFFMGLIGMIIAGLVNIFIGSSMVSWVISGIGVIVFTGLTAYDVQRLLVIGQQGAWEQDGVQKAAILGALTLYLDFINLFLSLLHFLGDRR